MIRRSKLPKRETVREGSSSNMKELEKERKLRLEAEQRLRDTRMESDTCRARLKSLQEEFTRMEETVQSMLQYKTKIEELKQEKSNLAATYESSIQKHRSHISKLERENIMLLNQVKKLEAQINCKSEESPGLDKSKLLMERLKILEAENSGLVLENEQQRQQYEKCLDEIANQVVQALLAQKSLREECTKLQGRVQDLELQNQQLRSMFQTRIRYSSDSYLQKSPTHSCDSSKTNSIIDSNNMAAHVLTHHHQSYHMTKYGGEINDYHFLSGSLQSMNSDCSFDDSSGQPQMSSPPPWLRDKLEAKLRENGHDFESDFHTKIETEFPANNSSPKIKHVNVKDRSYGSWGRTPPKPQRKGKSGARKSPRNSQNLSQNNGASPKSYQKLLDNVPSPMPKQSTSSIPKLNSVSNSSVSRSNSNSPKPKHPVRSQYFYDYSDEDSDCRPMTKDFSSSSTTSLNELLDTSQEGVDLPTDEDFYSDWSPKSLSPKPLPTDLSAMKTMQNFMYPSLKASNAQSIGASAPTTSISGKQVSQNNSITSIASSIPKTVSNTSDLKSSTTSQQKILTTSTNTTSVVQSNKQVVSIYGYTNGASPKACRPENLILAPRDKNFILNSLSTSSSEGKTLSTPSPASASDKSVASQTTSPVGPPVASPTKKSSSIERRIPKSKHYVEIQVKKPNEPKKKSAVESSNKSKIATIVPTPRSPKKSPPPVPKKPARSSIPSARSTPESKRSGIARPTDPKKRPTDKTQPPKSPTKKLQGIVNPIVNPVVNSVLIEPTNFPVLDVNLGPKVLPQETNLDSVRVERSGSRDDGYSTMSSDIQPEAMEKFSDASTIKKNESSGMIAQPEINSDPDSAMENSSHSAELQNSTHSLSSQVSTSSTENLLSPGSKVREMRKVFEEDTDTIKNVKKPTVMKSSLGPKLEFFQSTESKSLENLPIEKLEESPDITVKTSWNYHSFNEPKVIPTISRFNYFNENQPISLPIGDEHQLVDIPEDQELVMTPVTTVTRRRHSPPSPPTPPLRLKSSVKMTRSSNLERTMSDSCIYSAGKSRAKTLYDDFSDGQWNSAKIFERSTSVSEVDLIDSDSRYHKVDNFYPVRSQLVLDEEAVNEQTKHVIKSWLMSKMSMTSSTTDTDSESDMESSMLINKEWLQKCGDEQFNSLKKKTQDKQNPYLAYSDLSYLASSSDTSTVIGQSTPDKDTQNNDLNVSAPGSVASDDRTSQEDTEKSPSPDQKKFHSEFYSLCLVESNRSLVSSSSHETDIHKLVAKDPLGRDHVASVKEFDEISRQIQSLSRTVNDLHQSLSSINSADSESRDDLHEYHPKADQEQSHNTSADGYHWEEDEFYLTSCGGEVIIGSNSLLAHENCSDWLNQIEAGAEGNHSGDINEEFYEIQVNGENCTQMSGYVYNSNHSDDIDVHDNSFDQRDTRGYCHSSSTSHLPDVEHGANVVENLLVSGGDSNDSLASDIGLDHMMCQRLVGRKERHDALRSTSIPKQPIDFSKFFIRFDQPEKEAVAAFNFLDDISTSDSGSEQRHLHPDHDSSQSYQAAEVYIVDNHATRSRRGDKIRRRKKLEKNKQRQLSASSVTSSVTSSSKSPSGLGLLCAPKKLNKSLNTSSESPELCDGNLSLSDSCCESFSSSDQSVNDLTML